MVEKKTPLNSSCEIGKICSNYLRQCSHCNKSSLKLLFRRQQHSFLTLFVFALIFSNIFHCIAVVVQYVVATSWFNNLFKKFSFFFFHLFIFFFDFFHFERNCYSRERLTILFFWFICCICFLCSLFFFCCFCHKKS